jgi:XRE family transcriptional regulator, aerobic/anaerobic benzoate catabolism transcriptional regulator
MGLHYIAASMVDGAKELLGAVGTAVRRLREERGLSRRALSDKSGVSERFLADLEGGTGNISVVRLAEVARALGTTAAALLREGERERAPGAPASGLLAGLSRDELREAERWLRARFGRGEGPLVALVGLRGAGKSTIGRDLAAKLSVPFFELDALVEQAAGLSLPGIFSLHGEAYYRRLAREVLTRFLAETEEGVLATGGGLVLDREAWRLLQRRCRTVWLQATPDDHWQRVLAQGDERPSAASPHARDELRALLKVREPLYAQAEMTVDTSRLGVPGAVREVLQRLTDPHKASASRRRAHTRQN